MIFCNRPMVSRNTGSMRSISCFLLPRNMFMLVNRNFEREDDEHFVNERLHLFYAGGVPCPHLRRYIVDDGNAMCLRYARQLQVESGVINKDKDVRLAGNEFALTLAQNFPDERQMLHHFGEPEERHFAHVSQELHAFRLHLIPADAE